MASVTHLVVGVLLSVLAVQCRESLFSDLTHSEMEDIQRYLEGQTELQIISHSLAKVKDSYVFVMEAYRPNKTEALGHLDKGQDAPTRAARVVIHRGDLDPPRVEEYRVWPIPNPANHAPLTYATWTHPIPFHARSPFSGPEEALLEALVIREFGHIEHIIKAATGGYTFSANCTKKCLRYFPAMPAASTSGSHQLTGYFVRDIEGGYLFPIGLQFVLVVNSVDEADWTIGSVWFRGHRYTSFRDMGNRLTADLYDVISDPEGARTPDLSSSMNFRGTPRPAQAKRGPATYMPDGPRFEVEEGSRRVTWMGWEFEFGMLASSGIQLFDINFLKKRIVYELALQELSVFYSGGSPISAHTNYYDSVLVFGLMTARMFPGIDCPTHAQFFDFSHYMNGVPHVFPNGACLFEMDRGVPLRKHYETDFKSKAGYKFAQGMPDNVLVFRHMLTVLNYDYMIDVMFHQGGQVEVKLSLTGYVLTTFYTGHEMDKYGHRLNSETAIGNVHHHTANFKVDMDIMGTKNRFETLDIVLEDIEDDLTPGQTLKNRYVVRSLKRTEEEAAYKFNFDTPKYLIVYNEEEKTKYGDHRGYRLLNDGMSKMLLPEDYRGVKARAWTNYQVAVTKHKEDERTSTSIYTATEPFEPVMSFDNYITDEGIVDEDLVLWVTLGSHHIPHTEDIPVVNSPGVQLTFYLLPYHYFDQDPSLASRDNIRVVPDKDGGHDFQYSGVEPPPSGKPGNDKPEASCVTSSAATRGATLAGIMLVLMAAVSLRGAL